MTEKNIKEISEHVLCIKKICDEFEANGLEYGFERDCNYEELKYIEGQIDKIISLMALAVDC